MKISFYIVNLTGGGAEKVFVNLINHTCTKGHEVELVLNERKGPNLTLLNSSVKLVELNSDEPRKSVFEISAYLKNNKPDLLVSTLSQCNYAAILGKQVSRTNTKVIVREANSFLSQRMHLSYLRRFYERLKAGIIYRFADRILTNSEGSKKELIQATFLNNKRVEILYNPIDFKDILKKSESGIEAKILEFLNGSKFIVSVGRLEHAKGFDMLINSFQRIENKDIKLIILGEGSCRSDLENLIKKLNLQNRVYLAGHVINPYPVMKNAALFVLSSRYEGMPNVLIEAMFLGVPIVSTDCPNGPSELIKEQCFGKLVEVDNIPGMTETIDKQLYNTEYCRDKVEKFLQVFDQAYVNSVFFKIIKSLYQK